MKNLLFAVIMVVSSQAFGSEVLERVLISKVSKYRNLMPGAGPRNPYITLIEANYERCGNLTQENVDVKVKKVSEHLYRVSILAPAIDCAGIATRKQLHISLNTIPHDAQVSFENPVLIDYLGDVH